MLADCFIPVCKTPSRRVSTLFDSFFFPSRLLECTHVQFVISGIECLYMYDVDDDDDDADDDNDTNEHHIAL